MYSAHKHTVNALIEIYNNQALESVMDATTMHFSMLLLSLEIERLLGLAAVGASVGALLLKLDPLHRVFEWRCFA